MATSIKPKRGLESTRANQTPTSGELTYAVDTNKIYFGDGATAGGIEADYMDKTNDESISGNKTFNDNLIVTGDITVNGTATTVNSNEVNIGDSQIVLNSDEAGTPSQDGGVEIERGTSTNAKMIWNEATDKWQFGITGDMNDIASDADVTAGLAALESYDQSLNTTDDVQFDSIMIGEYGVAVISDDVFSVDTANTSVSPTLGHEVSWNEGVLYGSDRRGWRLFDGSSSWWDNNFDAQDPPWFVYNFGASVPLMQYTLKSYHGNVPTVYPKDWTVKGSNTGAFAGEEVTVHTVTDEPVAPAANTIRSYTVDAVGNYQYYRFEFTGSNGHAEMILQEVELKTASELPILSTDGLFDGRNVSVDGAALDTLVANVYDQSLNTTDSVEFAQLGIGAGVDEATNTPVVIVPHTFTSDTSNPDITLFELGAYSENHKTWAMFEATGNLYNGWPAGPDEQWSAWIYTGAKRIVTSFDWTNINGYSMDTYYLEGSDDTTDGSDGTWVELATGSGTSTSGSDTVSNPDTPYQAFRLRWVNSGHITNIKTLNINGYIPIVTIALDDEGNISLDGNLITSGTVDGRDVSVDGAALDALVATGASSYDQDLNTTDDVEFNSLTVIGEFSGASAVKNSTDHTTYIHAGTGYTASTAVEDTGNWSWHAFDSGSLSYYSVTSTSLTSHWIQYRFNGTQKYITSITLRTSNAAANMNTKLTSIVVEASNTGAFAGEETTVGTITEWDTWVSHVDQELPLTDPGMYEYYRVVSVGDGTSWRVNWEEIQFNGYDAPPVTITVGDDGNLITSGTVDGRDIGVDGALLDSIDAGSYDATFGNLTVTGTTTTVNSNEVNIGDNIMVLNSDEAGTPSQDAGIEVERGTSTNAQMVWVESADRFEAGEAGSLDYVVMGTEAGTMVTATGTAQSAADAAQGTADTAVTNAATAQSAADALYSKVEVDALAAEAQGAGLAFAIVFG
jgi:hypothetical protein